MAIQGKEKEVKNFSKHVGMFNAHVVALNPTKEELGKVLGTELEKDLEYTSENADTGAKKVSISFWLREAKTNQHFNVRFNLEDTVVESKTGKTQFINSIGTTSYANDKSSLPDWFTEKNREVRVAKRGEELLYKFLRNWLSNLNYEDESTELTVDWKKLISGKTNELRDAITKYEDQQICALATVRTAEDGKEYQGVYSYEFLPGFALDYFTGKKTKMYKSVDKFIEKVTDAEYGCKDYYVLKPLSEYDPTKNVVGSSDNPVISKASKSQAVSTEETVDDNLPF